jgi:uncharacterized protein YgiM (DUF1202 family)
MIRLTLLLIAAMFATYVIFGDAPEDAGETLTEAAPVNHPPAVVAEPVEAAETNTVISPVNPLAGEGASEEASPSILQPVVIADDPEARDIQPLPPLPEGEGTADATDGPPEFDPVAAELAEALGGGEIATPLGVETPVEPLDLPPDDPSIWYVIGDKVNIRAGNSTDFAVLGAVTLGQSVTILTDPAEEWVQIELADGQQTWIATRFLSPVEPLQ